ncbi:hypothetical protein LPJ57_004179 [Coemansia sp. RSA 486]|nr:hypothetical protein LPJ57_004179 [Coemansia sp. RSA 486]KAJ2231668.1 hypothetical protein IWW45_005408 [Coemansia sp. RSA 485]
MRSGPWLEIVLDKPELLVRGSFDEAAPVMLSGKLVVHLQETIRVRSLKLTFNGRVDTFVSQSAGGSSAKDEHREIVSHEWVFLEPQKPPVMWGPENRSFDFDLLFQGDNPETVVTALGKIRYQLQATLERTSFHGNLVATTDVPVKRGPMPGAPWALALMESIEAAGDWNQQLDYRVSVPTRSLKDSELFHTRFELEPRTKGLKLISVGVLIKEYARYYSTSGEPLHRFARVVARNENYISPLGTCSTVPRKSDECMDLVDATSVQIPMAIPKAYSGIQYDILTDVIEIRHRIKFLIKVRDSSMLVHSIFIAVPVSIMPVTARDDTNILPRYETALLNPGTIIMRSNTLPPTYDAAISSSQPSLSESSGNTAVVPRPEVNQCAEVDGFPCPLHRNRSQFYLASPDNSPPLQPISTSDIPSSTSLSSEPNSTAAPTISVDTLADNSRRSSACSSSKHPSSLHDLLSNNKLSDKVRSIFHSRHNSISEEPPHEVRSKTPPPPARVHDSSQEFGCALSRRRCSVAPQQDNSSTSSTMNDNRDQCWIRSLVESSRNSIKPPPEAVLHNSSSPRNSSFALPVVNATATVTNRPASSATPPLLYQ